MVSASVGFQCPECVREGAKTVRQARTVFGGVLGRSGPVVTGTIIGICVVAYLLQEALGDAFTLRYDGLGLAVDDAGALIGVAAGEPYRLLTSTFLHANPLHLLLNMYGLYLFGRELEGALGRWRFLALYLLSGLGGSAASYAFSSPQSGSIGASGGVLGMVTAMLVVNRRLQRDNGGLWVVIALNMVLQFTVPNVDWKAHVGGMVTGALATAVLVYAPRGRRTQVQAVGLVVLAVGIAGVVVARTAQIRTQSGLAAGCAETYRRAGQAPLEEVVPIVENSCGETTRV
jgi:membrane associated rhomboid family serine protease